MPAATTIAPGAFIELRDAVWRVQRVDFSSTGKQAWRCLGVSEIVRDQEAIFLEEYEPDVRVLDPSATRLERDISGRHRAGLLYIESLLRDVPPPLDGLYIGHLAAMDALEYQLEPAWLALSQPRQRILIADAVGLGKTLEAGILLAELIRRGRGRRILVVTTKSMLTQFQKELWARFTIPLVRLDSVGLARIRSHIPSNHNPFYHYDKTIISIDTLKQNNWFRTHVEKARWDVVVIDEAHNVASRGSGDGSLRAGIAARLAQSADSLILLSATPHDGKAESFASLMNLLDPTAIANPSRYSQHDIEGLYVRRFKGDIKEQLLKQVPEPRVHEARADASPAEELAFDRLTAIQLPILDAGAQGDILFRTGLTKALFSSPRACLAQLRAPLRREAIAAALPAGQSRRLLDPQLGTRQALAAAAELVTDAALSSELQALAELAAAVEAIGPAEFSKYRKLLSTLTHHLGWSVRRAKEDRLLIFTERRETLEFLAAQLRIDLELGEDQLARLHGGLSDLEQQEVVEHFGKASSPLRVLVASDVASEGLNLHYLCHRLIHFDMPWSLMIFLQRNGRIDRYGQKENPQIVYLRTDSENEAIRGDNRILDVLREKADQARENIGDPSAFLGVFAVDAEEKLVEQAMQEKVDAETFNARLETNLRDPFTLLLEQAARAARPPDVPIRQNLSLFASDFEFFAQGLESLRESFELEAQVDHEAQQIELRLPADLARRFRKLPREVLPQDGVLLLTADPAVMQQRLESARKEENSWPQHQYLWPGSPVVSWMCDRLRAAFSRHTAPVLVVPRLGDASRSAVLVSGLLPNRRGQPLVHRWYVVHFAGRVLQEVEAFADFLASTRLGREPLPNAGEAVDLAKLESLLAPAVEATRRRVVADRDRFRAESGPKLADQLDKLDRLRGRQLDFIGEKFAGRSDAFAGQRRSKEERRVRQLFAEYQEWIRDAMTTADAPFLQVVAVLVGDSR